MGTVVKIFLMALFCIMIGVSCSGGGPGCSSKSSSGTGRKGSGSGNGYGVGPYHIENESGSIRREIYEGQKEMERLDRALQDYYDELNDLAATEDYREYMDLVNDERYMEEFKSGR